MSTADQNATLLHDARGSEWLPYGDAMRLLGVLAVVLVHVCDMIVFAENVPRSTWWAANIVDATGRWAVPVFVMLSGALLLDPSRNYTPSQFYRKRLARLGLAIAFWSVVFALVAVYYTKWQSADWSKPGNIWQSLLYGRPYVHLHFVFRLAGLYAITPMLRAYTAAASFRLRVMTVLILLGLAMANSVASAYLKTEPTAFTAMWPFLVFYLAGNVLREITVTRALAAWSAVGYALCVAGMALGTGWLYPGGAGRIQPYPSTDMMLYDFLNPLRVGMALCAWFVLAYLFSDRRSTEGLTAKVIRLLAPMTLGIYLVHPLLREILHIETERQKFWGVWTWPNVWLAIPMWFVAITIGSLVLTAILRLIPGLRRITG
jgi:surface polysaccharide O-acyltransferase-like enzyme